MRAKEDKPSAKRRRRRKGLTQNEGGAQEGGLSSGKFVVSFPRASHAPRRAEAAAPLWAPSAVICNSVSELP